VAGVRPRQAFAVAGRNEIGKRDRRHGYVKRSRCAAARRYSEGGGRSYSMRIEYILKAAVRSPAAAAPFGVSMLAAVARR